MSLASNKIIQHVLESTTISVSVDDDDKVKVNKSDSKGPVRDQFTMDRKGRKWHFAVRRNEFGQISDIDVEEMGKLSEAMEPTYIPDPSQLDIEPGMKPDFPQIYFPAQGTRRAARWANEADDSEVIPLVLQMMERISDADHLHSD